MATETYVHIIAPDRGSLFAFRDDADDSFLEYGVAPEVGDVVDIPVADARRWSEQHPADTDADGWLGYLCPEALAAVETPADGSLCYVGVSGLPVVDRLLRETTGVHPSVVLQSHTASNLAKYTVYRYDETADQFGVFARGRVD
ncbi:MAG: hypothetical protein J07HX64_01612 [halophilic archaeon J07HX64]|jgi:hypothetical protein|nr:MAG: hypothetical protein J07HX64_01612 [halophilic archaeon J07HX64]